MVTFNVKDLLFKQKYFTSKGKNIRRKKTEEGVGMVFSTFRLIITLSL